MAVNYRPTYTALPHFFAFYDPGSYTNRMSNAEPYSLYLMAHFGPEEKLYYAISEDARLWEPLNRNRPVFDCGVRLRDPYIVRVKGIFHMTHTMGIDHPFIYHWESKDLMNWSGGPIKVIPDDRVRCWAPEFTYVEEEDLFYVYWSSFYQGFNQMHYVTTRDWKDITPDKSAVYYETGDHVIDLTITKHGDIYYAFHKPGVYEAFLPNTLMTTKSLNPKVEGFVGKGVGQDVLKRGYIPTEGPEIIKLINEDRWYIYVDPFHYPMDAWETTDFKNFKKIAIQVPFRSKHCSMLHITPAERDFIIERTSL